MKTTLELPDHLFKQAKARAALDGVKLKDLVSNALAEYLKRPKQFRPEENTCPFPIIRGRGGPLLKKMSNKTIARLEEEADLDRYGRSFGR